MDKSLGIANVRTRIQIPQAEVKVEQSWKRPAISAVERPRQQIPGPSWLPGIGELQA